MSENTKAVLFAAILSLVCCILVTAACTGLMKYQVANAELDRQVNIIRSVGLVEEGRKYTSEEVNALYNDNITRAWAGDSGKLIYEAPEEGAAANELYLYKPGDELSAYIIPFGVRGLWGKIYGYLAINKDGKTVEGFTVFNHAETPGLGGEIESSWFRKSFSGKEIVDTAGEFVSVGVAKGAAKDSVENDRLPNYVDGISGATLTGSFLASGLKDTLQQYEGLSSTLREEGSIDEGGSDQ